MISYHVMKVGVFHVLMFVGRIRLFEHAHLYPRFVNESKQTTLAISLLQYAGLWDFRTNKVKQGRFSSKLYCQVAGPRNTYVVQHNSNSWKSSTRGMISSLPAVARGILKELFVEFMRVFISLFDQIGLSVRSLPIIACFLNC